MKKLFTVLLIILYCYALNAQQVKPDVINSLGGSTQYSTGIRWYGGSNTNTRARADGVGAGKENTALIIANLGAVDGAAFAATVCSEYSVTVGGITYGDCYLPSKCELNLLYLQKAVVGGIGNNYY